MNEQPSPSPAVAVTADSGAAILPGAQASLPGRAGGGVLLFRHAGVAARTDSPSVAELQAAGWTVEHENHWGGALMRREVEA